jgi:hypothetical protein
MYFSRLLISRLYQGKDEHDHSKEIHVRRYSPAADLVANVAENAGNAMT